MSRMNYNKNFISVLKKSKNLNNTLDTKISKEIDVIGKYIESKKGVYTVLITLSFYKSLHPKQDIRYHQSNMKNGFSGRSFDTKYITPNLKEIGFPSMSESGWLTRSLEQPYPYNFQYDGKLGPVKKSFLRIVDFVEKNPEKSKDVLMTLLHFGWTIRKKNKINISPLKDSEKMTIEQVISLLNILFHKNYNVSGGSKLPVICFHSVFQIMVSELRRYKDYEIKDLGYHTTSDKTSKSSGDIEIYNMLDESIFESIEIKYNIKIDNHLINRVIEKIKKFNPHRYYIFSTGNISSKDRKSILSKIKNFKEQHGCEIIIDDTLDSLRHFLRSIKSISNFINIFTTNILNDKELKLVHKKEWKKLIEKY